MLQQTTQCTQSIAQYAEGLALSPKHPASQSNQAAGLMPMFMFMFVCMLFLYCSRQLTHWGCARGSPL